MRERIIQAIHKTWWKNPVMGSCGAEIADAVLNVMKDRITAEQIGRTILDELTAREVLHDMNVHEEWELKMVMGEVALNQMFPQRNSEADNASD